MAKIDGGLLTTKTQNEYFEQIQELYAGIDPGWIVSPATPDGLKAATDAEIFANLDEAALAAHSSKDPRRAVGSDLDMLCALNWIERRQAARSSAMVTVSGTSGTEIPAGKRLKNTETGTEWITKSDSVIGDSGTASVYVESTSHGMVYAAPGSISEIVDPVYGWESAHNELAATLGRPRETDAELRARRNSALAMASTNQLGSLHSAISSLDGVKNVSVLENYKNSVDLKTGLPPHSFSCIVDGGDDTEIAQAIYSKKSVGSAMHAVNTLVETPAISDETGNLHNMVFSRPVYVPVSVAVEIKKSDSLPADIEDQIKTSIMDYAAGGVAELSGEGFDRSGFGIGVSVPVGRLYTPVNYIIGQYAPSFCEGITINGGQRQGVEFNEIAQFSTDQITVTIA